MTYYKQIDSCRFLAATLVLISHWFHHYPLILKLRLGTLGVEFFFVISGFLISLQLLKWRKQFQKGQSVFRVMHIFFLKRTLRIFPLYYLVLMLATLFNRGEIREAFWYNFCYASNFYFIEVQHWNSIFSQFWSLSVEEHFYLLWPLPMLLIKPRWLPYFIGLVFFLAFGFRYYEFITSFDYFILYTHSLSCFDLFMSGSMLALFLKYRPSAFKAFFSSPRWKAFFLIGFIGLFVANFTAEGQSFFKWVVSRSFSGILSAIFIGFLVLEVQGWAGKLLNNKWLIQGGKLSYGIYLTHNFVPGILLEIKKLHLPYLIEALTYFIVTILISFLLYRIVEQPLRKVGNRIQL